MTAVTVVATFLENGQDVIDDDHFVVVELAAVAGRAATLADGARAEATRRAYRSDWGHFADWCERHRLHALPAEPQMVGLYLAVHEASLSMATLTRRLSTISTAHRLARHQIDTKHPAIRDVMRGLK